MKNSELLAEIIASDALKAKGYTKVNCEPCNGTGIVRPVAALTNWCKCVACDGVGHTWQAPKEPSPYIEPEKRYMQDAVEIVASVHFLLNEAGFSNGELPARVKAALKELADTRDASKTCSRMSNIQAEKLGRIIDLCIKAGFKAPDGGVDHHVEAALKGLRSELEQARQESGFGSVMAQKLKGERQVAELVNQIESLRGRLSDAWCERDNAKTLLKEQLSLVKGGWRIPKKGDKVRLIGGVPSGTYVVDFIELRDRFWIFASSIHSQNRNHQYQAPLENWEPVPEPPTQSEGGQK